jgi:hypothetical protein
VRVLGVILAGFAVLLLASACGGSAASAVTAPSVTVKAGPVMEFPDQTVTVFTLTPTGHPNGVVALKSVRDGHVRTFAALTFHGMNGSGLVGLRISPPGLAVGWGVQAEGSGLQPGSVSFPAHTVATGPAVLEGDVGPASLNEVAFWVEDRYQNAQPSQTSTFSGSVDGLVRASLKSPSKTSYFLSLKVDGQGR